MPVVSGHRLSLPPFLAGALAIGIFIFDTVSPLQFAVAVLYTVVVLITATYCRRRGVLMTAIARAALTLLSFQLAHGLHLEGTAPIRGIMSLAVSIGITKSLLRLTDDAALVLNRDCGGLEWDACRL